MKNELHRATRFLVCMEKYNQLKNLVRSPADHVNREFTLGAICRDPAKSKDVS